MEKIMIAIGITAGVVMIISAVIWFGWVVYDFVWRGTF